MGSDTCGSIRIPSAYQNLFGMRETIGLSSRAGIVPLSHSQDVGGPLARSVTDLAIMLDATVGADPADAVTAAATGHVPRSYRDTLTPDGLKGARIGVVRSQFGKETEDREVTRMIDDALKSMKEHGAEVMDIAVPGLDDLLRDSSVITYEFKDDLAGYLAKRDAPVKSLGEIIDRGLDHDQLETRLRDRNPDKRDDEGYRKAEVKRRALRDVVLATMEENKLDALAYPTTPREPPMIVDVAGGGGSTCQLSAATGLPAMAVPVGFTRDGLPAGMELLGAAFTEPTLLKIGYGWEQAAKPRHAPYTTPPLVDGRAPRPQTIEVAVAPAKAGGPAAHVKFTYDVIADALSYDASVSDLGSDKVIAVTLQRGTPDKPGAVLAQLVRAGNTSSRDELRLRARDRDDLEAGRLYVHLYTQAAPLGVGRAVVRLPASVPPQ
jgi:Asp-tRNA(Asn)/Glu-tRNA(Gln) amidotransferase A subunit family amidase